LEKPRDRFAELQMKMELDVEALEKQLSHRQETQYKPFEEKCAEKRIAALEVHQLNSIRADESSQKQKTDSMTWCKW